MKNWKPLAAILLFVTTMATVLGAATYVTKPTTPPQILGGAAVLVVGLEGEYADGYVQVSDVTIDAQGVPVLHVTAAPHGFDTPCDVRTTDLIGTLSGGDWGPYQYDYCTMTPLLRSFVRQAMNVAGHVWPDCPN